MDEQNNPSTEPVSTTPDPVVNTPVAEPQQAEPTQTPVEPAPVVETPQAATQNEPITEAGTAQMAGSEPLPSSALEPTPNAGAPAEAQQPETPTTTQGSTSQPEPTPTPAPAPASMPAQGPQGSLPFSKTDDRQENLVAPIIATPPRNMARVFLEKAKAVIQLRKQKKLIKIMGLFAKKSHITNDEVEKLLHVSDATATRYLSHLEQQGKIKQTGKTGKGVTYTKT